MAATTVCDFRIGDWVAQPALNRIARGPGVVHLRPKLMDVLSFLALHAGEVVSQERILAAVWAKQFMAESVLTRCIAELRETLGDDATAPRYVETIMKRGYRLIARVEWIERPDGSGPGRAGSGGHATVPKAPAPCCAIVWGEREIPLSEGENVIGRIAEAAVRVSSSKVSRRHARIVVSGGRAVLEDLGSKNGTYVGGCRLSTPTELSDGDEICVGHDVLMFRFCYPMDTTHTDER